MNFEELQQKNQKIEENEEKDNLLADIVGTSLVEIRRFFADLAKTLTEAIKNLNKDIQKVQVTNPVTKIEVTNPVKSVEVTNLSNKDIIEAISQLNQAIRASKIDIPEVKFPKSFEVSNFPKQSDKVTVANLSEIVKHLDKVSREIVKAVSSKKTEVKMPTIAPRFEMKNEELLSAIKDLKDSFKVEIPEQKEVDLSEVVTSTKETTNAIKSLRFPVPNVASSWQHSLSMQAEDLPVTIAWKTVNGKKVMDYREFTGNDGKKYRKTYNYDDAGYSTGWTGWTR